MKLKALVAILAITILVTACKPRGNDDSRYETVPDGAWCYGDTISFPLQLADTLVRGNLTLALEHSPQYKYGNVWLELTYATIAPDSTATFVRDTMNIPMADGQGNWIGTGLASTYQLETQPVEILLDARKPITLRHIMRTDTLKGITRAGLFFKASPINPDDQQ